MKFIRYPQLTPLQSPTVVTIGNFDGVHLGHQALINRVTSIAKEKQLQSVVVTMQPLASEYFNKTDKTVILTPFKCKFNLIKQLSVDCMCVLNFNKDLSELTAEEFIQRILIRGLNAKHIIVGDDFKFGKNRSGDVHVLKRYCQPIGMYVDSIDSVINNNCRISSSQIRNDLSLGELEKVKNLLGRYFSISGKVSKGQQLGRTLNFPTINLKLRKQDLPLSGIYCVKVRFDNGDEYNGAASIGTRPTVGGVEKLLEVYILDFNKQVYGQNVKVLFYHKIRNEVKFDGLVELKRHIKEDVIKTRLFFRNNI